MPHPHDGLIVVRVGIGEADRSRPCPPHQTRPNKPPNPTLPYTIHVPQVTVAEQLTLPSKPILIGIAGCSGSGKTTLAHELAHQLEATLFPLDLYYRDLSHFPLDLRDKRNFDHPDSLESELFVAHIQDLARGRTIQRPIYDFATHSRVPGAFEPVSPSKFVLVEGILALHYPELHPLFDFSVYVDAPNEICLKRRIYRDMRERGRTKASVIAQFEATARPMADLYVVPSQHRATMVVAGTENLDWSIEQILRELNTRKLLS